MKSSQDLNFERLHVFSVFVSNLDQLANTWKMD